MTRRIYLALACCLIVLAAARPARAQTATGTIAGTVTSAGVGVPNVGVYVFNSSDSYVGYASTGTGGTYSVAGLPVGSYYVFTYVETQTAVVGLVDQIYKTGGNVECGQCRPSTSGGTLATVNSSQTTTVLFPLRIGPRITGKVTNKATGAALANIVVGVYLTENSYFYTAYRTTDSSGNYSTVAGFPSNAVRASNVFAAYTTNDQGYIDRIYNNVPCPGGTCSLSSGNAITFASGSTTNLVANFTLELGGVITGKITDTSTACSGPCSLSSAYVYIYDSVGNVTAYAYPDEGGTYRTAGLPAGTYFARAFYNGTGSLLPVLYDNIPCPSCSVTSGTPIVLAAGQTKSGVNFALPAAGSISGTIKDSAGTPLANAYVYVYTASGVYVSSFFYTTSSGVYTVGGLSTGSYVLIAYGPTGYIPRLYDTIDCLGCSVTDGKPIQVTAGSVTSGKDLTLTLGGTIKGKVTAFSGGAAISGISVTVLSSTGGYVTGGTTDSLGNYTTGGLLAGNYYVRTNSNSTANFIPEIFAGIGNHVTCTSCSVSLGTPIAVSLGGTVTGKDFSLKAGGTITGTVTANGSPLASGYVYAYDASGLSAGYGYMSGAGVYTITGLPAGQYFARTYGGNGLIDKVYNDITCVGCSALGGTPISVTAGSTTSSINFALITGGRISGKLTDTTGTPLASQSVYVYNANNYYVGYGYTDTAGNYVTTTGLPTGSYYVVSGNGLGYINTLFDNISCSNCSANSGTPVAVTAGQITPNINLALGPGARITGKVQATGNTPLAGVYVYAYTLSQSGTSAYAQYVTSTVTNSLGNYALVGIPTGTYFIKTYNSLGYIDQLHAGSTCLGCDITTGTPVVATVGATTSGIDFTLVAGGTLTGTVRDAATTGGLAGVSVAIYNSQGTFVTSANTLTDGTYTLKGLGTGSYYIRTSNSLGYVNQLYAPPSGIVCGSCVITTGTPISVTSGLTTSGKDFALSFGGSVKGTVTMAGVTPVTPINGVSISIYSSTGSLITSTVTDAAGNYTALGLISGTYFIKTTNSQGFIDQVYSGLECVNCSVSSGTAVNVTQGTAVTGKDFALATGGRIRGRVTDTAATPNPISGLTVQIYRSNGSFVTSGVTSVDGNYVSATGLPAGDYVVRTSNSLGWIDQLYDNVQCSSCNVVSGKVVTLGASTPAAPASAANINFALTPGGGVSGTVTASSGAPLQSVYVYIYTDTGLFMSSAVTNGAGKYTVRGLPAGSYVARTSNYAGYIDKLFNGTNCVGCSVTGGTPIGVTVGDTTTGIDFSLTPGGRIAGRVTGGGVPIQNVSVQIYNAAGQFMTSGYTSPAGTYLTYTGLPTGKYYARTFNSSGFINELYADVVCQSCTVTGGTPIDVTLGATTTVDFDLDTGGSISGKVTDLTPVGLAGVSVLIYTQNGTFMNSALTAASGDFIVGGLPTGTYVARTSNSLGFIDEQYDNQPCQSCRASAGKPIFVTKGLNTPLPNIALAPGGAISGAITDVSTGAALAGVAVQIYNSGGFFVTSAVTDNLGKYATKTGLQPGTYYARTSNGLGYINVIYPSSSCLSCSVLTGTAIAVGSGAVGNINFALQPGGRISGTITNAVTGQPLSLISVSIYLADGTFVSGISTNANGLFTTQGLPSGTYYARTANSLGYINRLYDAVDCVRCAVGTGKPIAVTQGSTTAGVNFALSPGARVAGVITDAATNAPLAGASVTIYDSAGFAVTSATANAIGEYITFAGLTSGTYYARTFNQLGYINKLYDTFACLGCTPTTGKPLVLTTGVTASGINFSLNAGGRISGTVSAGGVGLADAYVAIYSSGGTYLVSANTGTGGQYITGEGLPPGKYFAVTENYAGFINRLFDAKPCPSLLVGGVLSGCAVTTGTAIVVTGTATTPDINFTLELGGRISGKVTDKATGGPVYNLQVNVYDAGGAWVGYAFTDGLGNYTTYAGLPDGNYTVLTQSFDKANAYVNKLFNDLTCAGCDPLTGTKVAVHPPATTVISNLALERGEQLSGTVKDKATGWPIANLLVRIYNSAGVSVARGTTDDSGVYLAAPALPAGTYYARTINTAGFIDELYDTGACLACDVTRGTAIVVDGAGVTTGINFDLVVGGKIAGRVTSTAGGNPIAGSFVRFFNLAGSFLGETLTNGLGDYVSTGLPPGSYFVRTMNAGAYIDELYNNAPCAPCRLSEGSPVPVVPGTTTAGIDFALDSGGLISGYVRDQATGSPIMGVTLSVYRSSDHVLVGTTDPTDGNGYYKISLPVGKYDVDPNPVAGYRPVPVLNLRAGGAAARSNVNVDTGTETTGVGFDMIKCGGITVTPSTLGLATYGQPYSKQLVGVGGTGSYTFALAVGLPTPGLTLTKEGLLTGSPTATGTANFTAAAVDGNGCAGTATYALLTCSLALASPGTTATSAAGSGSVAFSTTSVDCPWIVTANVSWISVTSAVAGAGPSTATFSYTANPSATSRTGTITVGGQTYTITQAASDALPTVSVDRASLAFAATASSTAFTSQTSAQTVHLGQTGSGTVTWTAASNAPWLVVSPTSGSGAATLTVSVKFASGLIASQTGNVTVTFTGAGNTAGPIAVTLTVAPDTTSPPFGVFDTPAGDATVLAGSIAVTGWALDNVGVQRLELWRDLQPGETTPPFASTPSDPRNGKVFISNATFVDNARPDVEALNPTTPFKYRAGWGYLLLTWGLWNQGNGTYNLYAFAFDQENNVATIGKKTIVVSNTAAVKPFGSIDTPGIGAEAAGPNFGWALTPKVNGVATCKIQSNGAQVSIDSGPLQPVHYGDLRTDIAGAFPGFSNSNDAGGNSLFDWSTLANGTHTIGWYVTDDCNRADGIGSRFFQVSTGTNQIAAVTGAQSAVVAPETESSEAITVAHGFGELPVVVAAGEAGSRTVEVTQQDRVEIRVPRGFDTAYQLAPDGQRRALPTGSTWDATSGTLSWQPAPGFLGRYRIVFTNGKERISLRIVVVP